jgi:hypothetical protein
MGTKMNLVGEVGRKSGTVELTDYHPAPQRRFWTRACDDTLVPQSKLGGAQVINIKR